jgi:hypothetical protein
MTHHTVRWFPRDNYYERFLLRKAGAVTRVNSQNEPMTLESLKVGPSAQRLAGAAATAVGVGLSALTFGAAPSDPPPPCPICHPGHPGPGGAIPGPPGSPWVDPPIVGGGPKSGGRPQIPGIAPATPGP